jgi:hypothetical protein
MDYFKFTCPHCQTRIGTTPDTAGAEVNCPSCNGGVIIPPAPSNEGDVPAGIAPATSDPAPAAEEAAEHTMILRKSDLEETAKPDPGAQPTPAKIDPYAEPVVPDMDSMGGDNPFATVEPAKADPPPATPEEKKPEPTPEPKKEPEPEKKEAPAPAPEPEAPAAKKKAVAELIGNLTPEIKCELVKVARSHIDKESKWVHGRATGKGPTLAARKLDGDFVGEKFDSPSATHFSIVGALFLAMEERNVKSIASGRAEMLHDEIENAARKITGKTKEDKVDPLDLSHENSLKVLDTMYAHYARMGGDEVSAAEKASDAEGDLKELLEKEAMKVTAGETLKVLAGELAQLKIRISELENNN